MYANKTATKFKVRNIALREELGNNLYNVERALDENRDKKRREKRRLKLKAGVKDKDPRRMPKILQPTNLDDPFSDVDELSYHTDESGFKSNASR